MRLLGELISSPFLTRLNQEKRGSRAFSLKEIRVGIGGDRDIHKIIKNSCRKRIKL